MEKSLRLNRIYLHDVSEIIENILSMDLATAEGKAKDYMNTKVYMTCVESKEAFRKEVQQVSVTTCTRTLQGYYEPVHSDIFLGEGVRETACNLFAYAIQDGECPIAGKITQVKRVYPLCNHSFIEVRLNDEIRHYAFTKLRY